MLGFEHPLIHLGHSLEFSQPCIVAEALTVACIYDDAPDRIFQLIEDYRRANPNVPLSSLLTIINAFHDNP